MSATAEAPLTRKMVSIVVPCYRDAENIHELMRRLTLVMERVAPNYEVIYVNDASPDNAEEILNELARTNPKVTVIHHSRNFRLMGVYNTGLRQAIGDAVVLMDGDLQDPPEVIEEFVRKWVEGYLVVYGQAAKRKEKVLRKIGMYFFYRIWDRISDIKIPPDAGDFSLIDRKVVDILNSMPEKDRLFRGLRAWVGFPQTAVKFVRDARFAGETTQSYLSYFSFAGFAITSFSYFPLRMVTMVALSAIGFCGLAFFLIGTSFLLGIGPRPPTGTLTILGLLLVLSTAILSCLAAIAEYLIRIYIEVKNRPSSLPREILNDHRGSLRSGG